MWSQISGGEVLRTFAHPTTINIDGVTYPRQVFMDKVKLKSFGILPYREDSIDHRYYYSGTVSYTIGEDEVVGSYASPTDKDVDQLKKGMLDKVNQGASSILVRDDWQVIREQEGGTVMSDALKKYRSDVRTESNAKVTEIGKLKTLAKIIAYQNCPYIETRKKEITAEDGSISYGDNYESERDIDLSSHYFSEDPQETDNGFVSLVKI